MPTKKPAQEPLMAEQETTTSGAPKSSKKPRVWSHKTLLRLLEAHITTDSDLTGEDSIGDLIRSVERAVLDEALGR